MEQKTKNILFITIVPIVFVTAFVVSFVLGNKSSEDHYQQRLTLLGDTEFKGKVIHSKQYEYSGKTFYMVCVKIDWSNKKDFYLYKDQLTLKIKDSIATFCGGVFLSDPESIKYVEVNMNNSKKISYYRKNGEVYKKNIDLGMLGLREEDLNSCDNVSKPSF